MSQTESFGTIPIEDKVLEETIEEALKSKEDTRDQNPIVEEATVQY